MNGKRKEGKYIIIIGASELVVPAFRIAKDDLNLKTIAFDYNENAPGMLMADVPVKVSTKDVSKCVEYAKLLNEQYNIVGVFTEGADVEVTVAAVAEALNLKSVSLEVADRCNNKLKMHAFLDKVNFRDKARCLVVENKRGLSEVKDKVGFPCVIKPLDNCASRGVVVVENQNELEKMYDYSSMYNIKQEFKGKVLVEEYLEGSKHTVEMIVYSNKWYLLSIIDTHYISKKWPCELGLNTTLLDSGKREQLFQFSKRVAELIGINFGAHKVDVNLSRNGEIKLVELTARLSGGFHCQYVSPLAYGTNDIRAAMKLSIGLPLDLKDIEHKYERGAAVRAIFPKLGIIKSIKGVEDAKKLNGVEKIFIMKKVGDRVGPYRNSADRVGFVISSGATTEEAIFNAELGVKKIHIETV